jgi:NAD(P)-dependent dehydrogenase (short-subunit alcohol dehydrogenase family)
MSVEGKVAIITGGGQGIGAGIVECFAKAGAKVAIFELVEDKANALASTLSALGHTVKVWLADVSDYAAFAQAVDDVVKEWGRVDVLVNNAGMVAPPARFIDTEPAEWERMINVDFKGVLNGVKACAPHMERMGSGAIINIASDTARFGEPGVAVYSGCKGAVNSASKSLAKELAKSNIRVNVISPGLISTPIIDFARSTPEGEKMIADTEKTIPLGRMGQPKDIGNLSVFLASDQASYMTGQTISVNGGMIMFG